ncbi:OmpP1/FadL family transporter [Ketobacter sp.]|uniref:OmpP1/FadL family transporter n=1 Tax=Ketobacter sp. TaxID=2083498 RepID=UPI000F20118E|nr:outer membrane protein transport protein [Ketobacter sp.]RLT97986.1 MAG: hypothetical protein D9N14_10130 [Ketobacter sp.]
MDKDLKLDQKTRMLQQHARYLAFAAAIAGSTGASAQLLHNVTIGNPKALGLGNAVTADPPGIDSIHFNPAGLSKIKGRQMNIKLLAAHMTIDGSVGSPTKPTDTTKSTFYEGHKNDPNRPECNSGDTPTQDQIDQCWGYDPIANTSTSIEGPGLMLPFVGFTEVPLLAFPSGGIAFEDPSRGWTFGTAVYSPQGIGYIRDDKDPADGNGDPGSYQGVNVGVTRLTYFSPTVAIPVSEKLSFGVGVNFSYQGMALDTYIRAPLETTQFLTDLEDFTDLHIIRPYDTVGRLSLEMDDYLSVGFNFGILYEPYDWLSFGFLYQSETTSQLSGDYKMENTDEFQATTHGLALIPGAILGAVGGASFNGTAVEKGTVELEYLMPQNLSFGTSIKLLPNLKVNVDLRWVEYSVWDELQFEFSNNVDFLNLSSIIYTISGNFGLKDNADPDEMRIRREYDDTWSLAIGAEYQWNDNLVLRAGYEPRTGAIPSSSADMLFPIGDADLFTAGFGWQISGTTRVDAAIGVLYSEQKIDACESSNANTCNEGDVVYNPYYSMPFETETTAYIGAISIDKKF